MQESKHPLFSWLARVTLVALAYCLAGRLALLLAIPPGFATAVWPAAGVALIAMLIWGYGVWPGLVLGSFLTNIWTTLASGGSATGGAILIAGSIGVGASLQGLLGAWLVRKFVGYPNPLIRGVDVLKFCVLGGPTACVLGSLWGVSTLCFAGFVPPKEFAFQWVTWWVGDSIGVLTCAPLLLVAVGEPRHVWRTRSISVALPTIVTFGAAVVIYIGASRWEQNRIEADFRQRCIEQATAIQSNLDDSLHVIQSLAIYFESKQEVTRQEFSVFARHLLARQRSLQALEWIPWVPGSEKSNFERDAQSPGLPTFRITEHLDTNELAPAGVRDEYFPVLFVEPFAGNEAALGFDLGSESVRMDAIHRARHSSSAATSGPIRLVQGGGNQLGFLVFHPVYRTGRVSDTIQRKEEDLRGFALAVFSPKDRIDSALAGFDRTTIDLELWDDDSPIDQRLLYSSTGRTSANSGASADPNRLSWSDTIEVGGRTRRFVFNPSAVFLAAHRSLTPWSILAGSLLFTGMLCTLLLIQSGRTVLVQQVVDERTAELRTTNSQLTNEVAARKTAQAEVERHAIAVTCANTALKQKNAELDEFTFMASHDLQEPVRKLVSFSSLLKTDVGGDLPERAAKDLVSITNAAKRMETLVQDLLRLSRAGRDGMKLERIRLAQCADRAMESLAQQIESSGAVVNRDQLPDVLGDVTLVTQLYQNLIGNAVKYRTQDRQPTIRLTANHGPEGWVFGVQDNGIGIKSEYFEQIFAPFKRLHGRGEYEGTGIGLAICRKAIERHGGRIWVESELGRGSHFKFTIGSESPTSEMEKAPWSEATVDQPSCC